MEGKMLKFAIAIILHRSSPPQVMLYLWLKYISYYMPNGNLQSKIKTLEMLVWREVFSIKVEKNAKTYLSVLVLSTATSHRFHFPVRTWVFGHISFYKILFTLYKPFILMLRCVFISSPVEIIFLSSYWGRWYLPWPFFLLIFFPSTSLTMLSIGACFVIIQGRKMD